MRLSDLLHVQVVDSNGDVLGSVDDVRLVQDGPLYLPFGAALRVDGIVVGRGGLGTRLGYHRGGAQGPWILRAVFGAMERRARYVFWDDVTSWDGDVVRIAKRADELGPPPHRD